jgi:hypothetical protein
MAREERVGSPSRIGQTRLALGCALCAAEGRRRRALEFGAGLSTFRTLGTAFPAREADRLLAAHGKTSHNGIDPGRRATFLLGRIWKIPLFLPNFYHISGLP